MDLNPNPKEIDLRATVELVKFILIYHLREVYMKLKLQSEGHCLAGSRVDASKWSV